MCHEGSGNKDVRAIFFEGSEEKTNPQNRLRQRRQELGFSQVDLAERAGVTRQTVGGIEAGQYGPSLAVAFRLAKALNTPLEDLFWLPVDEQKEAEALWFDLQERPPGSRVHLARLSQELVAYPVNRNDPFMESDGVVTGVKGKRVNVQIFNQGVFTRQTVLLAGCSPALALLSRRLTGYYTDLTFYWLTSNSMQALNAMKNGFVHGAGLHLLDEESGNYNLPVIKKELKDRSFIVCNLYHGEQGFLVARGNPKGIRHVYDLIRDDVRLFNREKGAEARRILDAALRRENLHPEKVHGYNVEVNTHLEMAQAVAFGGADCGIAVKNVAHLYNLDFVPLTRERYDMVFLKDHFETPGIQALLENLNKRQVKDELEACGYDISMSGKILV